MLCPARCATSAGSTPALIHNEIPACRREYGTSANGVAASSGVLSFEMARLLRERGERAALPTMLDSGFPRVRKNAAPLSEWFVRDLPRAADTPVTDEELAQLVAGGGACEADQPSPPRGVADCAPFDGAGRSTHLPL
jgi:hypothetical protein